MPEPIAFLKLGSFKANPHLIAELVADQMMTSAALDATEDAAEHAIAFAPIDEGDYRDSIEAQAVGEGDTIARLTTDDYKAHWIEWGSANNPPHAPLRRGVIAAGLTFKEGRG